MRLHTVKIAVSTASILACLLLLVFWVRSHWVCEALIWNGGHRITIGSAYGQIRVIEGRPTNLHGPLLKWQRSAFMPDGIGPWYFQSYLQQIILVFPYRFPIVVLIFLVAVPWIHWRFSLRSVLIAVTVVALVLGLLFAF